MGIMGHNKEIGGLVFFSKKNMGANFFLFFKSCLAFKSGKIIIFYPTSLNFMIFKAVPFFYFFGLGVQISKNKTFWYGEKNLLAFQFCMPFLFCYAVPWVD